jgi:protein-tyrosine phosphatase
MTELEAVLSRRRNIFATEIVQSELWLGSGTDAANIDEINKHDIKCILNVSDDVPNYHIEQSQLNYLQLHVADFGHDLGIRRVFNEAFNFLDESKLNRNSVLIHCAAGANRSATLTIAYMMYSRNWNLREAWDFVTLKRKQICPQKDMRIQLLDYELELYGRQSFHNREDFIYLR